MTPLERRSVIALASLYAMRMLGLFMLLPVFVLYGTALEGATVFLLGVAMGAYGLSQALLQVPFGMLSDRIGRKPVIYAGLLLFALGSLLAAGSDSIYGVILGRILQGAGAIASTVMALLADLTTESSRTKAMAAVGMTIGVSFALALVLGPLLASWVGLSGLFAVTAGLALLGMLLLWRAVPNPQRHIVHRDTSASQGQLRGLLRHAELLRLDAGVFTLHAVVTSLFIVTPLALVERAQLAPSQHAWVYLSVMGLSFLAMVPFIIVAEKYQRMKPVFVGAIVLALCAVASMPWLPAGWAPLWWALFAFFMAFNLLEASLPSLVSKIAPAGARGTAMGIYSSSQFMGAFVGGAAGGWLLQHAGATTLYGVLVALLALWAVLAASMQRPRHYASYVIRLDPAASNVQALLHGLGDLPGVEDSVVVGEEHAAYLKVDRQRFDASHLKGLPLVQRV